MATTPTTASITTDLISNERQVAVASPLSLYNDPSFKATLVSIPSSNVFLENPTTSATSTSVVTTSPASAVVTPLTSATAGATRPAGRRRGHVSAKNAHLPTQVLDFKEKRKVRTIASAWTGGAVGLFTLGPLGAVIGAYGGYAAAKSVGKQRERNLIKKCQQQGIERPVAIGRPIEQGILA